MYDGFFKKISKAVSSAAKTVTRPITTAAARIDPTNPKNVGKFAATYITRPIAATAAAGLTGGLSVLASEKLGIGNKAVFGVRPTVTGLAEGAVIGGTILAAPVVAGASLSTIGTVASTGLTLAGSLGGKKPPQAQPAQAPQVVPQALPEGYEIDPATGALRKKSGGTIAAALAGAGVGLITAGPVGAVVGAGAGIATGMVAAKKAQADAGLAGYSFRSPAARRGLGGCAGCRRSR
jgi:hypothetical protein